MPLSDALAAAPTKRALNHSCSVALVLASIAENDGPAEAEKVAAILRDPARVATNLAAVLRANGHHITGSTIQRHRRGECSC